MVVNIYNFSSLGSLGDCESQHLLAGCRFSVGFNNRAAKRSIDEMSTSNCSGTLLKINFSRSCVEKAIQRFPTDG